MNAVAAIILNAEQSAARVVLGNSVADKLARSLIVRDRLEAELRQAMHIVPMSQHERAVYLIKQAKEFCESITGADFSAVVDKLAEAESECGDVYADADDTLAAVEEMRRVA